MEKQVSTKPNLFELEALRTEIIDKSNNTTSNSLNVFLYYNYFDKVLTTNNPNFTEAFLKEFIDDYVHSITKFEVFGTEPEFTKKIITHLKVVNSLPISVENIAVIKSEIERIEKQLEKINLVLDGKDFEDGFEHKAFFPLIDKEAPNDFYGIIDSVSVSINKRSDADKILIIPSEKEIEDKISEQCKNSWSVALGLSKNYIKYQNKFHEVIISFDKRVGFYEGNSLGIAITLSFLEQLLKFYNPTYIINIKEHSAFTGGVESNGKILLTGEEIIKQKVNAIFFSEINSFVIPKYEETYAYFALTQLKKDYPNRNLKLIPVEDINDVINRRDLVDIKKQKIVVRTGKFVKKNWISAAATVLLAILFGYLFVMDFDDNPSLFTNDGSTLFVKNKNEKLLFTLDITPTMNLKDYPELMRFYFKIVDINNDKENELIFVQTALNEKNLKKDKGTVICFDKTKKILWKYTFQDTVYSERENLQPLYNVYLIDTTLIGDKKIILCFANNSTSFSSAIFGLNLKTGERIKQTQWNSGFTWDAIVEDINDDGKKEFVGIGADNGLRDGVIWEVKLEDLNGYRPTTTNYKIMNFEETNLQFYIRLTKNDFEILNGARSCGMLPGSLTYDKIGGKIRFITLTDLDSTGTQSISTFYYSLNKNYTDFEIFVTDKFSRKRDSLVISGKLKNPFTDTKEYKDIIKSKVLYWKDRKWVKRKELD